MGIRAVEALRQRYGTQYKTGNIAETICRFHCYIKHVSFNSYIIYLLFSIDHNTTCLFFIPDAASGTSLDWVKGNLKLPIVFTYEFRDNGRYGFLLPAKQIIPNGEEVLDSLLAMFQEASRLGYPDKS